MVHRSTDWAKRDCWDVAGKGSPKGSNNGGGMRKGQTTAKVRARKAAKAAAPKVAKAVDAEQDPPQTVPKLAKEVLQDAMNYFYGLAALYQPIASNPQGNETKFERYMDKAADIASKLAPYQSPRLANTVLKGDKDAPIRSSVTVQFVDGDGNAVTAGAIADSIRAAIAGPSPV